MFRFFAIVLAAFSVAPACWGSEPNFNPSSERGVLVFESVRSVTVPNDTLNATLVAEMTGQDATRLARQVNQMVARAKELAGKEETLQLRTLNYSTQPNFESGRRTGWMVRQTVLLESQDFDLASNRLAELQALGLRLEGLAFDLTPAAREHVVLAAKETALRGWMAQADMAVKTLGAKGWRPGRLFLYDGHPPTSEAMGGSALGMSVNLAGAGGGGGKAKQPDEKPRPLALDPGETSVVASVKGEALIVYAP